MHALAPLVLYAIAPFQVSDVEALNESPSNWPSWRGPLGTGAAPHAEPPLTWSEGTNVRWRSALPGVGHSTPVVHSGRVFLTAAVPIGERLEPQPDRAPGAHDNAPVLHRQRFLVLCVDLADGEVLWQTAVHEKVPHEGGHVTASFASPSPVTDGEVVVASFGSAGLFGLSVEGDLLWTQQLGELQSKHGHGEGSSPLLHEGTVVVNYDHEGTSFVVAFDARSGAERWRSARDEVTSWSTPIAVTTSTGSQAVVSGTDRIRGYDLETGKVVWSCGGLSHNVVASPVYSDGVLYAGSSYEKQALVAVRIDGASGDLTDGERVLWYRRRGTPYVPSPLLYQGTLWFLRHYQGVLYSVDVATGNERRRALRLGDLNDIYASPIGAAGRLYVVDRSGATAVVQLGDEPEVVARNVLDDRFSASPVAVGRDLLLRGERYLYCLTEGGGG